MGGEIFCRLLRLSEPFVIHAVREFVMSDVVRNQIWRLEVEPIRLSLAGLADASQVDGRMAWEVGVLTSFGIDASSSFGAGR